MPPLAITPIADLPLFKPGDDIAQAIAQSGYAQSITQQDGDIFVITQKIISKVENRYINLADVTPSNKAIQIAEQSSKDPRLVELILSESNEILRVANGTIIVEHRLGFVCANAGIDQSNIDQPDPDQHRVLLLPKDPSASAKKIKKKLEQYYNCVLGILVIDSHGRAWRNGVVGMSIGGAGMPYISDQRGLEDIFGTPLKITQVAVGDELAAAASLMMGQANERVPVVHVRGFPYTLCQSDLSELFRDRGKDLFR